MARRKDVTKSQVLDEAENLVAQRGFNGFSTRELADELGISSASLHHHFATKGDLVAAVVGRCRERVNERLARIAAEVEGFSTRVRHFSDAMRTDAMLLAMSAGDFPTLPVIAQNEVRQLFTNLLGWLGRFAAQAKQEGELSEDAAVDGVAAEMISSLLGRAMLSRVDTQVSFAMPASSWAWQR